MKTLRWERFVFHGSNKRIRNKMKKLFDARISLVIALAMINIDGDDYTTKELAEVTYKVARHLDNEGYLPGGLKIRLRGKSYTLGEC